MKFNLNPLKFFKKNKVVDPGVDESFLSKRGRKAKKRIKRHNRIINLLFVFALIGALLGIVAYNRKALLIPSQMSEQFTYEFLRQYYVYPQSETTKTYLSDYGSLPAMSYNDSVSAASVGSISINDKSAKALDQKIIQNDYNVIITLNLTLKDGSKKAQQLTRTVQLLENKSSEQFGVFNIQPYYVDKPALDKANLQIALYQPTKTSTTLSESESTTAKTFIELFLKQYNEDYSKAVDLQVKEGVILPEKSSDVTYSFTSITSASKNKDGNLWYIQLQVKISNVNGLYSEAKNMEIWYNTTSGRIEKMEVY